MSFSALPPGSSGITASPWDNFEEIGDWVALAELHVTTGIPAFWHCVEAWTSERHFNRNLWRIDLLEQAWSAVDGSPLHEESPPPRYGAQSTADDDGHSFSHNARLPGPPPRDMRWVALRELQRKTPSPIGGGADGSGKSFSVLEWTAQYVAPESGHHTAVFALVVPESARKDDNPRALTYWPFQYPKIRAMKVSFEPDVSCDVSSADDSCVSSSGMLRYTVLPLETGKTQAGRDYEAVKVYASKAAMKLLNEVRKRAERFDPVAGVSTYVKRVEHDNLVPEELYRSHFRRLKESYGYHWVENWPEVTDPVKFVYEELSIAAYLIALFELEQAAGAERQCFADLGCGNGFLTYILLEEGFEGYGVDRQKRGIWDLYPSRVTERLKLDKIDPSSYTCPPEVDWIIGNHSDELTPFLPVICARSQQDVGCTSAADREGPRKIRPQFFVIPCCFFDFDERKYAGGFKDRKFAVKDTGQGRYAMYLTYIEMIAEGLGFCVERENLRIPSTKYVALLGRSFDHPENAVESALTETLSRAMQDARRSHAK